MTVSARAILANLQLAPRNHEDWKEVQPRSGTEVCSKCRRMEESSLAGLIAYRGCRRRVHIFSDIACIRYGYVAGTGGFACQFMCS